MQQFIGLILAFLMLPVILKAWPKVFKKKAPLGPVLMITGLIIAGIGGLGIDVLTRSMAKVFTTFSSLQTLIVVVEIGILGSILKQYGILDKIVHALEQLIPTDDRPLSQNVQALQQRYNERYHIYCSCADVIIKVNADAQTVAEEIQEKMV